MELKDINCKDCTKFDYGTCEDEHFVFDDEGCLIIDDDASFHVNETFGCKYFEKK